MEREAGPTGPVTVEQTGENEFLVSIPEFIFIGYDEPTFKTAVEDGGILGWVTPDVDKAELITEILNEEAQQKYVDEHDLWDQAVEIAGPAVETWAQRVADEHGYTDLSHTVEIFGLCPSCRRG